MKKAAEEFKDPQEKDLTPLLADLQQKILGCHQIEKKAFKILSNTVK